MNAAGTDAQLPDYLNEYATAVRAVQPLEQATALESVHDAYLGALGGEPD